MLNVGYLTYIEYTHRIETTAANATLKKKIKAVGSPRRVLIE
jgi:hypothetical protein